MNRLRVVPAVLLLCGCLDLDAAPPGEPTGGADCGDGLPDEGEACDDGAANGPDAPCSDSCTVNAPVCRDGVVQAYGGEACDDGDANDDRYGACTTACRLNHCGDGVLDEGEACDDLDGNSDRWGACTQRCTLRGCGDGVRSRDETCDGGSYCGSSCRLTGCGVRRVIADGFTSLLLLDDGRLLGAGRGKEGQLGTIGEGPTPRFRALFGETRFRAVELRFSNGIGLREDGVLVAWGDNTAGQLGTADVAPHDGDPTVLDASGRWIDLAVGSSTVFALRDDGAVFGAGDALERFGGQPAAACASDDLGCRGRFIELVEPGHDFVAIDAGREHLVALDRDGRVHAWGCGSSGELAPGGDPPANSRCTGDAPSLLPTGQRCVATPTRIEGQVLAAVHVVAGARSTAWLDRAGALFVVGENCNKHLGVGSPGFVFTPTEAGPQEDGHHVPIREVTPGLIRFGALLGDRGGLWTFGADAGAFDTDTAGAVSRIRDAPADLDELAVGGEHLLARRSDGAAFVVGQNGEGQRGTDAPRNAANDPTWEQVDLSPFCAP